MQETAKESKLSHVRSVLFIFLITLCPAFMSQAAEYDLLLKGGTVLDPKNSIHETMDVAISDGRIAALGKNIASDKADKTVDITGLYVSPGFIDIHAHLFHTFTGGAATSVIADHHCFQACVTTCVDAGTSGADNFPEFKKIIDNSRVRILAFLNISRTGMNEGENVPEYFDTRLAAATAKKYDDIIVGFKSAHYWRLWKGDHAEPRPYDKDHTPWASMDSTLVAGNLADLPVMVDFDAFPPQGDWPARSYRELILEKLRPGDIHTHCYARHFTVVDENGVLNPDIPKARKRGVLFDVGHGGSSIIFKNAVPAIEKGYKPDMISTDLHQGNVNGPVVDMVNVMSKFLNMGLTLEEIISRVTDVPADILRRSDLGHLGVGAVADVAVYDVIKSDVSYVDSNGSKIYGDRKLESRMTVFGGDIVFDPYGLSFPFWKSIPKGDPYWGNPSGQKW